MGTLFRSEEMVLCQLFLQSEAAYSSVSELGEIGMAMFRDLNPDVNSFQRKFVNEVKRCDEMERKLRFFEKEIKREKIEILDNDDNPEAPQPRDVINLEELFEKMETELKEVTKNAEALLRTHMELTELKIVLKKTQQFFDEMKSVETDDSTQLLSDEGLRAGGQSTKLEFVAGVILKEKLPSFELMLWRVCRGNALLREAQIDTPLEDPLSGDELRKSVFIVCVNGQNLKNRVTKICEAFQATTYPCPEDPERRIEMIGGITQRIDELNAVLSETKQHRHQILVKASRNMRNWFVKVRKIKAIYHTLNKFNLDVTQKCLIAECWCPIADLDSIHTALNRAAERSGSSVPSILNKMATREVPPTFNRTNKFTRGFQNIINAYGVGKYREVNPTPYTIITFPFLFAVMFGDAGHGLLMTLFALWMVLKEKEIISKKWKNEIFNTFFNGRFIILLMGLFSIYTGLLYNDIFSKSVNIFGSSWRIGPPKAGEEAEVSLDPAKNFSGAYPFGVDPIWQVAENKIVFLNSYKMKLSVILGVCHMLFGVFLSAFNHSHFKNGVNIVCEFIPRVIFMLALFGYMDLLIIMKWMSYNSDSGGCAPAILTTMINMFMLKKLDIPEHCSPMYPHQRYVQMALLALVILCVPWMLCFKPYILKLKEDKRKHTMNSEQSSTQSNGEVENVNDVSVVCDNNVDESPDNHGEGEEFDFGNIVIDQTIETIEYCLGCVSHTASYLRLWALSLAHAELSDVLWTMVLRRGLTSSHWIVSGIFLYFIFAFWAILTVSVLLVMEGLSAFLHALRLHWVEFQDKFYKGNGYLFQPFSFEAILEEASNEEY